MPTYVRESLVGNFQFEQLDALNFETHHFDSLFILFHIFAGRMMVFDGDNMKPIQFAPDPTGGKDCRTTPGFMGNLENMVSRCFT
jgi:hypothetical protein